MSNFYQLEEIELNLSFKNVLKLENEREEALSRDPFAGGSSFPIHRSASFDKLKNKSKQIKSKIKIKGDKYTF